MVKARLLPQREIIAEAGSGVHWAFLFNSQSCNNSVTLKGSDTVVTYAEDSLCYMDDSDSGNTFVIEAGTYSYEPEAEYIAAGYTVNETADGYVVEKAKAVASVNGTSYITLAEAVEKANAGDTVTLLADTAIDDVIYVDKDLTIDGKGYTVTCNGTRSFRTTLDGAGSTITYKNLNIDGETERGFQVDSGVKNVTLTIDNCNVDVSMYGIHLGPNSTVNVTISDSEITAYGALNIYSAGFSIEASDSTFNGVNDVAENPWNNFGTIVVEGDTTNVTTDHASDNKITFTDCTITAVTESANMEFAFLFNTQSTNNVIELNGDMNVTYPAANDAYPDGYFCLNNGEGNSLVVNGGKYSDEGVVGYVATGLTVVQEGEMYVVQAMSLNVEAEIVQPDIDESVITEENEAIVDEIINSPATAPEGLAEAIKLGEIELAPEVTDVSVYLKTTLKGMEGQIETKEDGTTEYVPTKVTFEVKPHAQAYVNDAKHGDEFVIGNEILNKKSITFTLPIPKNVTEKYAKMVHYFTEGGSETDYLTIKTDAEGNKFVTITVSKFSTFEFTFTNTKASTSTVSSSDNDDDAAVSNSVSGTWLQDAIGWRVRKPGGSYAASEWYRTAWNGAVNWYYFDADTYMKDGWFTDVDGRIYFLHNVSDNTRGRMYIGWNWIDGKCYYFEERPGYYQGHLYQNTTTPDGYTVNANGEWIVDGIVQTR